MNGLFETRFDGISEVSGEASGGTDDLGCAFVGDGRGGREGGASSTGDTDFTVMFDAVEDKESLLDVRLILEGLMGDRCAASRASIDELILLLNLEAMARTPPVGLCTGAADIISSCEDDLTRGGAAGPLPCLPRVLEGKSPGLGMLARGGGGGGSSGPSVTLRKGLCVSGLEICRMNISRLFCTPPLTIGDVLSSCRGLLPGGAGRG